MDNFYAYVGNSPFQFVDPTGTEQADRTEIWQHYKNVGNSFDVIWARSFASEALREAVSPLGEEKRGSDFAATRFHGARGRDGLHEV